MFGRDEDTKAAAERGQTVLFAAGNGVGNARIGVYDDFLSQTCLDFVQAQPERACMSRRSSLTSSDAGFYDGMIGPSIGTADPFDPDSYSKDVP